ncbi:MAG: hypothetical protein R3B82_24460 [Sandaracinaceae bacterium]
MALLGLNAWAVVFLVPTLHLPDVGGWAWAAAAAALVPFAVGLSALGRRGDLARLMLLGLYPPLLGVSVAVSPELVEREVFDPITVLLAAASLLVFVGVAARGCARSEALKPSTTQPSGTREPVGEPRARRWIRRALLALTAAGGFAMVGVAPVWTDRSARAARWGEAQDDGAVLAIVVASVAAAFVIGAIVGPGLRAERRPAKETRTSRRRLWLALAVAAACAAGWLVLAQLDARG